MSDEYIDLARLLEGDATGGERRLYGGGLKVLARANDNPESLGAEDDGDLPPVGDEPGPALKVPGSPGDDLSRISTKATSSAPTPARTTASKAN